MKGEGNRAMNTEVVSSAMTPSKYVTTRFGPGKATFPVSAPAGHAQFEHVRGVPAGESTRGMSVNRLFILNSLLGRYTSSEGTPSEISPDRSGEISEREIAEKAERLRQAVDHSVYGESYGNGLYEKGQVVSMLS